MIVFGEKGQQKKKNILSSQKFHCESSNRNNVFKIVYDFIRLCNARIKGDKEATWPGYTAPINICTYILNYVEM